VNPRPSEAERLFTDPLDRLHRMVERGEAAIEDRRAELAEVRHALLQLRSRASAPQPGSQEPVWQHLSADLAPPLLRQLTEETVGMVRSCVVSLETGPGLDEESIRQSQDLLARRRIRQRTLYPMDVLEDEVGRQWLAAWAAFGEEQRLSLAPPSDFAIFDQHAVVAVARWGDPAADYVLIRDPMLISAFTALFDRAYARGLPVAPFDESDEGDLSLIRLLGLGLKDESIARYLGVSLRTVRRRVAALMAAHGAQTRFQLGVAAAREDLVALSGRGDR
jgi:hypothetical protein